MLTLLLAVGGWNVKTTVDNNATLRGIERELKDKGDELVRISADVRGLADESKALRADTARLETRVSVMESKVPINGPVHN